MLTRGNGKLGLGGRIWGFGLPSRSTCPGRTAVCSTHCYSARIETFRPSVRLRYERNLILSRRPDFTDLVCRFIERRTIEVVRIHTSGDFYSCEYARRWLMVMRRLSGTRFYFYSRSWRVPSIRPVLGFMSRLPNVSAWYSLDAEAGLPGRVPIGVRLAWIVTNEGEEPVRADLIFRTGRLRRRIRKRIALTRGGSALICPSENGVTGHRMDCERCGICWQPPMEMANHPGRVGLPALP